MGSSPDSARSPGLGRTGPRTGWRHSGSPSGGSVHACAHTHTHVYGPRTPTIIHSSFIIRHGASNRTLCRDGNGLYSCADSSHWPHVATE